jgi:hypothetical protein
MTFSGKNFSRAGIFILSCILGSCSSRVATSEYPKMPTDREILSVFKANYSAFDRLREMAIEDSSKEQFFSKSHLSEKLSDARRQEYLTQFERIKVDVEVTANDQSIRFIFFSSGKSAIGPEQFKGLEYLRVAIEKEGVLKRSLDDLKSMPVGEVYLRRIDTNWFLVVQKTD